MVRSVPFNNQLARGLHIRRLKLPILEMSMQSSILEAHVHVYGVIKIEMFTWWYWNWFLVEEVLIKNETLEYSQTPGFSQEDDSKNRQSCFFHVFFRK